jgi:hypothetical protein
MATTAAMSAASVETAAATTVEAAATTAATSGVTMEPSASESTTPTIAASVTATVAGTIAVSAVPVSAAEPRTCSYKDAAVKPGRTVISVRRTSVRCVAIVAPLAYRSTIVAAAIAVSRVDANPKGDLGVRIGRRNHQNTK